MIQQVHQLRVIRLPFVAAAVLVLLVLGTSGCSSSSSASPESPGEAGSSSSGSATNDRDSHVDGIITALDGSTWTVQDKTEIYSVTVSPATKFGDEEHAQTKDQFKVGDRIDVNGRVKGRSVLASSLEKY